ncbi:unnamed protein product [Ambrosiozyma monospora]|uniref:Unnamed protein product n=1 Tax=Ambrosiozyma monospora TaxID=43982 RepID=A0ACB5SSA5_AMBMO|nr:unnamed protein product [Ambrosiozyma monospora]
MKLPYTKIFGSITIGLTRKILIVSSMFQNSCIHYGEAPKLPLQKLDVTSGPSQHDASGGLNMRCLYGPYLVLEYLKDMRPPRGEKEHGEVEKELAKLEMIGVYTSLNRSDLYITFCLIQRPKKHIFCV